MDERPKPKKDEKDEKGRGEKREKGQPSDTLTGLTWGAVFVVAGLIFLVATLNVVAGLTTGTAWSIVFLAAGIIFFIEAGIRLVVPAYRRPITGTLILAFVLVFIGTGGLIGYANIWPLIIIGVGVIILVGQFLRR